MRRSAESLETRCLLVAPNPFNLSTLASGDGSTGFVLNGIAARDGAGRFGNGSVDLDGDGFDDVLVGAPFNDENGSNAGHAYVFFGKPSGFAAEVELSSLNGTTGLRVEGSKERSYVGENLSGAGDINGDGIQELVIGAPLTEVNGFDSGQAHVLFGSRSSFGSQYEIDAFNGNNGFRINGAAASDVAGNWVSSAGDVNNDGYDDLLIGVDRVDTPETDAGAVYVIYGKPTVFPADFELSGFTEADGFILRGVHADERAGFGVHSADVNGDGWRDILVGNASKQTNGLDYAGEAYVVFGREDGFPFELDLGTLNGANGFHVAGLEADDFLGSVISSAGDLNGDGFDEVLLNAETADVGSKQDAGKAYVIFGKAGGFPAEFNLATLNGSNGFVINGPDADDEFSGSVAGIGDVNSDGFDDILLGAAQGDATATSSGEAYVIFGKASGFPAVLEASSVDGSNGFQLAGIAQNDFAGRFVTGAGDVNGDGFDDFTLGATGVDTNGTAAGAAYLIFGADWTGAVTHQGTQSNNALVGDGAANVMIGGAGIDTISSGGGPDIVRAGQGDDIVGISDASFTRIEGGPGVDELRFDGLAGITLELSRIPNNKLSGFEEIDLSGAGDHTLVVNVYEILNLSDTSNELRVWAGSGDTVEITTVMMPETDEDFGGTIFKVFTHGAATLKIQEGATIVKPFIELNDLTAAAGGDGSTGFVFNGDTDQNGFAIYVASAGDVNGDGFDDGLFSAFGATAAGRAVAGELVVLYGKGTPFGAEMNVSSINGANGFRIPGVRANDRLGWVHDSGDFNGDGFDDLILGAYRANPVSGSDDRGEAYVVFGKSSSFPTSFDLTTLDGTNGFTMRGGADNDFLSLGLGSAGDLNGDGYDDMALGAPGVGPDEDGEVYVIYGRADDFPDLIDFASFDPNLGFVLHGEFDTAEGPAFGDSIGRVAIGGGDLNGDGYDDLLIGTGTYNDDAPIWAGQGYVLHGNPFRYRGRIDLTRDLDGTNGFQMNGIDFDDSAFLARSFRFAGDFNGDGIDDLIIGAPRSDPGDRQEAGETYIVFGTTAGFPAMFELSSLDGSNGFTFNGIDAGDFLGDYVSTAGDVNADGYDDILIGVTRGDRTGADSAGEAYLIYGGPGPYRASYELSVFEKDQGFVYFGKERLDFAGGAVNTLGDLNGDGLSDFAVSSSGVDPEGTVNILFGRDFTGEITHFGDAGDNTINATPGADNVVAGQGDDLVVSNGGPDVLYGGEGDDVFALTDLNFRRLDGGNGQDVLRLDGISTLDLAQLEKSRVRNVEEIDLRGSGAHTLVVTGPDIVALSSHSNTLTVHADAGDTVNMQGIFTLRGDEDIGGVTYDIWTQRAATLKIPQAVDLVTPLLSMEPLLDANGGDGSLGYVINGIDNTDQAGTTVSSAGDVNGDGFDDALIAAFWREPGSGFGPGANYVVFGRATGFPAEFELDDLTGTNGFAVPALADGDRMAWEIDSAGDVNGDGFADMLFAAYQHDPDGRDGAGQAYVLFGKSSAFEATIDLNDLDGDNGFRISGKDPKDFLGFALSEGGDVNGDGFDDVIVGALGSSNRVYDGEAYVIFGKPSGFPVEINVADLDGVNGFEIEGPKIGTSLNDPGIRLARTVTNAGDMNGDGFDDVFISAAPEMSNGLDFPGEGYVVFGKATGFADPIDVQNLDGTNGFRIHAEENRDLLSTPRAQGPAGDFNGDGFDDLLLGAPETGPEGDPGKAFVILGHAGNFPAEIFVANLNGTDGFQLTGIDINDRTGGNLNRAGDVNGDGYDDLAISSAAADHGGRSTGRTYVVFGRPGPFDPEIELHSLNGQNGIAINGVLNSDGTSRSVGTARDHNGDGYDDLIVGAPLMSPNGRRSGSTFIYFGNDFNGVVTNEGDAADNVLTGTAGPDVMVGGRGDDLLTGVGGADALRGGQGDDVLAVSDMNFKRIVGGLGFDTLQIDGNDLTLDLPTLPDNRILGIERISAAPSDNTTINLSYRDVLNISNESNTLLIRVKVTDTVNLGDGWTRIGTEVIDSEEYTVYTQGAATVKVAGVRDIRLVGDRIDENTDTTNAVKIGDLRGANGQTSTFTLVSGFGDADNGLFQISGDELLINAGTAIDFETKSSYAVRVHLDDGMDEFDESLTVFVNDVNEVPTDISLSDADIDENTDTVTPARVGDLSATDVDAGDSHTFLLVSGQGDEDNATFQITGATLQFKAATVLDHETQDQYFVRVEAADSGGLTVQKAFVITINDLNEVPDDLDLAATAIDENTDTTNAVPIGVLTATDQDDGDSHTFALVTGTGDDDNALFSVNGDTLEVNAGTTLDHEAQDQYSIRLQTTDSGGLTRTEVLLIDVTDLNEAPTDITLSAGQVGDGADTSGGPVGVGDLTTTGDPDDPAEPFGQHALSLVSGAGDDDNASFQITNGTLQIRQGVVVDKDTQSSYQVRVQSSDGDNAIERSFVINVIDAITLTIDSSMMSENGGSATGTVTRFFDLAGDVTVTLASGDTTEAAVPASVTIPGGDASATFTITAIDDALLDGTQTAVISATSSGFAPAEAAVTVTDHEELSLSITEAEISESGGTSTATVTRTDPAGDLTVNLVSDDTSEATVVASIVIPDGDLTAPIFSIDAVDDLIVDGTQTVTVTASAVGYVDSMDSIDVADFEPLVVTIDADAISENGGSTTASVSRDDPSGDLTVTLLSDDTTEATVAGSVVIADGEMASPSFTITAVDDALLDGTQVVKISVSAAAHVDGADTLDVTDYELLSLSILADAISENGGQTTATVTRTDPAGDLTILLSSSDTTEASVPFSIVIANGQSSATFDVDAVDDAVFDGTQRATITAAAAGYEDASDTIDVTDHEGLTVSIAAADISENGGTTTATVSRPGSSGILTVTLSNSDTTEATIPAGITIADGQTSSTVFTIDAVDDSLVDGTQTVTVTAMASGYLDGLSTLDVTDFEPLSIVIAASEISEAGGSTTATVTRTDLTGDLTVNLVSDDTTEATVVASLVIPDGQLSSAAFAISAVDDALVDGTQTVTITASASGYIAADDTLDVSDLEGLAVIVQTASISENGGAGTAVVRRTDPAGDLTVTLQSNDVSEASVPASITIADGETESAPFNITAVDDAILDGTQTVTITANASGYEPASDTIDVTDLEELTLSISESSISENGGQSTATVTRTDPAGDLTVNLASGDTSEATVPAAVIISDGQASVTFSVTGVDDAIFDGTKTVSVTATAGSYVGTSDSLDVTDDDAATLTVVIADAAVDESDGAAATTVTVSRNTELLPELTVSLASDDTNEATVPAAVTIPAGQVSATVDLDAVDELIADGDRTVTISATAATFVDGADTIAVQDNDTATLFLTLDKTLIDETDGPAAATGTIRRNTVPSGSLTVTLTSGDTGEVAVPASITIPAGAFTATFDLDAIDEVFVDGQQIVTISAAATGHVTGTDVIRVDDDDTPELQVTLADGSVVESDGTAATTISVWRNTNPSSSLSVSLTTSNDTAATVPATIVIPAGLRQIDIDVAATDDPFVDGDQTATLTASATGHDSDSAVLAVTDDDVPELTVSFSAGSIDEGDGVNAVTGTVFRNTDPSSPLTVSLSSDDISEATVSSSVIIPAGARTISFAVNAIEDAIVDGTRPVTVSAAATGHGPGSGSLAVTDNDSPELTLVLSLQSVSENAGPAALSGTVTRNTLTGSPLVVTLSSADSSEATVPATVTIPAGQASVSFDIDAVDDAIVDGDRSVSITASGATHAPDSDLVMVTDDDTPELTLTIAAATVQESDGAAATTATVSRNTIPSSPLVVGITSDTPGEATAPAQVVIPAGRFSVAFNIDAVRDGFVDGSVDVTIQATATGHDPSSDSLTVTNTDVPTLTLTRGSLAILEGDSSSLTVTRNVNPTDTLTVNVVSSEPSEVVLLPAVTIPAGELSATIAVSGADDDVIDGSVTASVTASASGFVSASSSVEVENDDVPTISLSISPAMLSELSAAATGTVSRNTGTAGSLMVLLNSDRPDEVSHPSFVVIPSGSTFTTFALTTVADDLTNGDRIVEITPSALGLQSAAGSVEIIDDEGNQPPTIDPIDNRILPPDPGLTTVTVTGLSSGPGNNQPFRVLATSDNTAVVPSITLTHAGQSDTATLEFTSTARDLSNSSEITVTIEDGGIDSDLSTPGDNGLFSRSFIVAVRTTPTVDVRGISTTARNLELTRNGSQLELHVDSNATGNWYFDAVDALTIQGNAVSNRLIVDRDGLDPIPGGGLSWSGGGEDDSTGDTLDVRAGSATLVTHVFVDGSSGSVMIDDRLITYTGLEPIVDTVTATQRKFTFGSGSDVITLGDDGIAANGLSQISSLASSETVSFVAPANPIEILTGNGNNHVTVNDLDSGPSGVIVVGGNGHDTFHGGAGDDRLFGGGGRDHLFGHVGNDALYGIGSTGDVLSGGPGNDRIDGGSGVDVVHDVGDVDFTVTKRTLNGLGVDQLIRIEKAVLVGGPGPNRMDASGFFVPGQTSVTLDGAGGDDWLTGTILNDVLIGGADNDRLEGLDGNDIGLGQAGRDLLIGHAGDDKLFGHGGSGDILTGGDGDDLLNGGAGVDRIRESGDVDFTLVGKRMSGLGTDRVIGAEIADLTGGNSDNRIDVRGFNAVWTVITVFGGNDVVLGSGGVDLIDGGAGDDLLHGFDGADRLTGGFGDDCLAGGDGPDVLLGNDGNDQMNGGGGDDVLSGGDGQDGLSGLAGQDQLDGGNGNDTAFGGEGDDQLDGGDGADLLFGEEGDDDLDGGPGADRLNGGNDPGDGFTGTPDEIDGFFTLNPLPDWVDSI